MMKILLLTPYPKEGPSSRYRIEQYIPYLNKQGYKCILRPFIPSSCFKILYKKGFYLRKGIYLIIATIRRVFDLGTALNSDIIIIHLEAHPFGPPLIEWVLFLLNKKIIYDLDDAIYLKGRSLGSFMTFLKCPWKTKKIISISNSVITCNEYLADYARQYNNNIYIIHTPVNTKIISPKKDKASRELIIGWIGSHSTVDYLRQLYDVFSRLSSKYKFTLKIIGANKNSINLTGVNIEYHKWSLEDEIKQLLSFDIGVYPLPNDQWVLGKTGFKTIQYMSAGIPCVVSSVGSNLDIVDDGINGYLAGNDQEWFFKISSLIESPGLRKEIGLRGRATAETKFSLELSAPRFAAIIEECFRGIKAAVSDKQRMKDFS